MDRTTRPLVVVAAFASSLVIGLVVVLWLLGGLRGVTAPSAIGGPFRLTDQAGQTVTEKNLQGKPTLIFFGFTHCPDVCPTSLFEISEVLRAMGGDADRVNAAISVDPGRDPRPRGYLWARSASQRPDRRRGRGGQGDQASGLCQGPAQGRRLHHGLYALIYLMDRDGEFVAPFNLKRTPEAAAADLKRYL